MLIFGVKFESNSLLVYVLELLTIKIQTGKNFNEVLKELIKALKELIIWWVQPIDQLLPQI